MSEISGTTKLFAVFGDPIAHSKSPLMHNAAFKALNLDCVYVPIHVSSGDLPAAVKGIRAMGFVGVNLTIPHKQAVIAELDEITGDALMSDSVNTIINRDGRLIGTSTDGIGLLRALTEDGGFEVCDKQVLMLGAGGAAAAVIPRLIKQGIKSLTVVNRDLKRAELLQKTIADKMAFEINICSNQDLKSLETEQYQLLLNATSVGLNDEISPIDAALLHPKMFVYDFVYKSGGTLLCRQALERGCRALSGESMLLYQGAASFELWLDCKPPIAAMRATLN